MRRRQHPLRRDQAAAAELCIGLRGRVLVQPGGGEQRDLERIGALFGLVAAIDPVGAVRVLRRRLGPGVGYPLHRRDRRFGPCGAFIRPAGVDRYKGGGNAKQRCGNDWPEPICDVHLNPPETILPRGSTPGIVQEGVAGSAIRTRAVSKRRAIGHKTESHFC